MKKLVSLLALSLFVAASAFATPIDPRTNGIGVYFDLGATNNCNTSPQTYQTLTAYLIATNMSSPDGMSAWEGTLLINPTSFAAGISLDIGAGALEVLTPPVYEVGISPARSGPAVVLVTISTFYLGGPIYFGIGPSVPSSFADAGPGYADADDPAILKLFTPSSNEPWTLPIWRGNNTDGRLGNNGPVHAYLVARAGAACVTATEQQTWGGVKALY
jgi:hypothetical protein